jgi:hypothetical protein
MCDDGETVLGEPKCHGVADTTRGANHDRYFYLLCHDAHSSGTRASSIWGATNSAGMQFDTLLYEQN